MLIKYVSATGRETIASVVSVEFDPVAGELIGYGQTSNLRYSDGRAYVMNDDGKTISTYHLQPKPVRSTQSEEVRSLKHEVHSSK